MVAALTEAKLVELAAAGDRVAFGELARRHAGGVRTLLRRMGAQAALADDLAQDTFVSALLYIGSYRREGAFAAWLGRIAARLYVKRWRRDARFDLTDEPLASAPPETLSADAKIDLDEALTALNPTERLCVTLCHGVGMSHSEIAEAVSAPLGTVKSHVKRGMDKLRAQLAPERAGAPAHE